MFQRRFDFRVTSSGLNHVIKSGAFQRVSDRHSTKDIRVLTPQDTEKAMASIPNLHDFLPSGLWCVKFETFSTTPSDLSIPAREFQSSAVTSSKARQQIKDISFVTPYRCQIGHRVMVDFYVDRKLDEQTKSDLLVAHVMKHFILMGQTRWCGQIHFSVDVHDFENEREVPMCDLRNVLLRELHLAGTEQWSYGERCAFVCHVPTAHYISKL